jgi:hypothetical protein
MSPRDLPLPYSAARAESPTDTTNPVLLRSRDCIDGRPAPHVTNLRRVTGGSRIIWRQRARLRFVQVVHVY